MQGLVGKRFEASRLNRLHPQEEYHLLWAFKEHCPLGWDQPDPPHPEFSRGDWPGEFLGTWVDAACLTAWNTGDDGLRQKIDAMLQEWLATQQEDGYLGTYDEQDRWKSWDVWIQAHNLVGLLSYYHYTGSQAALNAATRLADRVLLDFGPGKNHLHVGPHRGMASSAILEPMIWLYWETGDERYLNFGRWLVDEDWDAPGGPAIVSSLMSGGGVAHTANAKGVEMLLDFAGLVELYRATGDRRYLEPVLTAWEDIVRHHLYITGSASTGEYFMPDFVLRNDGVFRLGETCVTMAWMYLNLSLGRLLGEARFFDMAEQALYNSLLGAQSPDGRGWVYYMGLRDSKRYRWHTDPECCPSKGTRALALMPGHVFGIGDHSLLVNFYEASSATLAISPELKVGVEMESHYPMDGAVTIKLNPEKPAAFKVYLRLPGWCRQWQLDLNHTPQRIQPDNRGYLVIERVWETGDLVELKLEMPIRVVADELGNNGQAALVRGPLVYAADSSYLSAGCILDDVILWLDPHQPAGGIRPVPVGDYDSVHLVAARIEAKPQLGEAVWREKERYNDLPSSQVERVTSQLELVPFFEAGNRDPQAYREGVWPNTEVATNITYQVWLPYQWK